MDLSLIATASTSISAAVELCRTAIDDRDDRIAAHKIAQINTQLLEVQQALFRHNMELLALQQAHFECTEKLRKAEEAAAERGRYLLVQVGRGQWAYRSDVVPEQGGPGQPGQPQPAHYLCQPCFDHGRKVVMQFGDSLGFPALWCPVCRVQVSADRA